MIAKSSRLAWSWRLSDCILCGHHTRGFASVGPRDYRHCRLCDLVFLEPSQRPDWQAELAEYQLHQNDPNEPGYRKHLNRLAGPLFADHDPLERALDFGCGPSPSLSVIMAERGITVLDYDPFFAPAMPEGLFATIAMSEVAEHLFDPRACFEQLNSWLSPGGRLGVMTELRQAERAFSTWHYIREISHVTFFSAATMAWLGQTFGWQMSRPDPRVTIFRKL